MPFHPAQPEYGEPILIHTNADPVRPAHLAPEPVPPLRVGLFASGHLHPRALVEAFAGMVHTSFAEIVLIAISEHHAPDLPWLWRGYRRIDAWASGGEAHAAEAADLLAYFASTRIARMPDNDAAPSAIDSWRTELAELELDVAFVLGDVNDALIGDGTTYGIWRLDFGCRQDGGEGLREVAERWPTSSLNLRVHLPGNRDKLLCQSCTRTLPFSPTQNRNKLLCRAASLPGRALKQVYASHGAALLAARPWSLRPPGEQATDSNLNALFGIARIGAGIANRALEKLSRVDQWFIAYRFGEPARGPHDPGRFTCLMPPRDRIWADPFPLVRGGHHYIFFEELVFAEGKAHISVVEIGRDGICSAPKRVLERPYHLSYPFLIESDGELFMVPETGLNGTVELYRCERFPDLWRFERVLLRTGCCADATFHRAAGRWWMFVTIGADSSDVHDELFLYHAERLDGEWIPHPRNPVKSDVRNARPAGRLYVAGGQLYRPAQIGAPRYGSGISINRVLKLSPEDYREEEIGCLVPLPCCDILGIHTFNRVGDLYVTDGFIRRPRLGGRPPEAFEPILVSGREADDAGG